MVWWGPNTTFHGFYALGSERFGLFFQPVFQTGSGGVILRFCVKLGVQPEPKIVTCGKRLVSFRAKFSSPEKALKTGRNSFQTAKLRLQSFLIDRLYNYIQVARMPRLIQQAPPGSKDEEAE